MSTPYLLILAAIAAACLYFARRTKKQKSDFKEVSTSPTERVVRVYDMSEELLRNTIDEFHELYSENGDLELPKVTNEGKTFRLTFSSNVDFMTMRYWVNYLVYCDETRQRLYNVCGWYPFGEVTLKGERQPYSNQTVMLYMEKNDKSGDNVYFVTPDGLHYIWHFSSDTVKPLDNGSETYHN